MGSALKRWVQHRQAKATDLLFCDGGGRSLEQEHMADLFREHLQASGITQARPQLLERSEQREPIRAHDQRAAVVTLALAAGRSEAWISDRTGHKSSAMIHRYHRQARMASELNLGEAVDLAGSLAGLPIPPEFPQNSAIQSNGQSPNQHKNPGTPGRARTCDQWIRNPPLYPTELRAPGNLLGSEAQRVGRTQEL